MKTKIKNKKLRFGLGVLAGCILLCVLLGYIISIKTTKKETKTEPETTQQQSEEGLKKAIVGNGLEPGAENEKLKLLFDNETGGVAVQDKKTQKMYYSTPTKVMEDSRASDTVLNQLRSPVKLSYYLKNKNLQEEMDSYTSSILLDQVSWTEIPQGIRVNMTIGKEEQMRLLPKQMSAECFDDIISKIESERKVKQMKAFYILYTLEGVDEKKKEELSGKYPILKTMDVYVLKTSATDRDQNLLEEEIKATGYTYDMLKAEYLKVNYSGENDIFPSFKFSVDYVLSEDSLEVSLDVGSIQYDRSNFFLTDISLLNYFGAGVTGEEGYVFLPDGSGTLIGFNNDGTKKAFLTTGKTYGVDAAESISDRGSFKQELRLPVFGIKTADSAIFGIIENGDAISQISCELGNIVHSYNTAYANFIISRKDSFIEKGSFEQAAWEMYDKNGYDGKIQIAYYFLTGEDANYVGMAKTYRSYLLKNQIISEVKVEKNLPFIMETIGSVKIPVKKLGVPMIRNVAVTSFDDAYDMITQMNDIGIDNIKLRYKAWYNGGYYYTAASKMKVVSALGGKKGLEKLNEKAKEIGAEIFPDVNFMYHDQDKLFDGYSSSKDGVRDLFQKLGFYPEISLGTLQMESWYYCVNPNSVLNFFDNFTKSYDKLGIENISLGSTGKVLSSNYKKRDYVNRQTAKGIVVDMLDRASEKYNEIMVDYGNAYTFSNADYILNLPSVDSSYQISEMNVPFAQIALHGYIQYAAEPINLSSDIDRDVLKCIEYGSIPYFMFGFGDGSILKDAFIFDAVYSVNFQLWKDKAAEIYFNINKALSEVQNVPIANHEQIADDVFLTTYENGIQIGINYTDKEVEINGVTVTPMNYALIKGIGGN